MSKWEIIDKADISNRVVKELLQHGENVKITLNDIQAAICHQPEFHELEYRVQQLIIDAVCISDDD